jgi:hypothetical protein
MVYLVHFTGCAETVDTEAASANARATSVVFIAFSPAISGENAPQPIAFQALALLAFRLDHWDRAKLALSIFARAVRSLPLVRARIAFESLQKLLFLRQQRHRYASRDAERGRDAMVSLDALVPKDHRKIDAVVDFSFMLSLTSDDRP